MLKLTLLGRPQLHAAGQAVPLPIRKTWALLVLLAVRGPASRAQLVTLLWPALDASTARRNLRRELARLREAGVPTLLRAEGDFLALSDATDLDLRQFDAACSTGRHAQALALWQGALADGLQVDDAPPFDDWLNAERDRLHARWRAALEACAAIAASAGDTDGAIAQLQMLLADDPLHERHHVGLMRLYAGAGRREAALAQYEHCRDLLRDELGLAPMAETEALAASLRRPETAEPPVPASAPQAALSTVTAADPVPAQLPFVGREAEVATLEAAWRSGSAVLIEGEAGVGKSRLALDFAAAHGPYALARCRAGDAELPYAAFTRALRALAGSAPALDGQPRWVSEELSRLLPELGATPPPIRSAEERSRFVEACARAWLALAVDNFDAVVLDDWHHADAASRSLIAAIAIRRRETAPHSAREWLLLRPEFDVDALRAQQAGLQALHLRLAPLPGEAVLELVRRLSGASAPARFAARLQQATAGNPFFLHETLLHLVQHRLLARGGDGVWHTPFDDVTNDYGELPVPASVHEAVLARVARLDAGGRRVLEAAALAAEPFVPALLAPACALSELDTVLAIEQAVAAQLLREHPAGGFGFAHDLVQQALDGALSAERRRLVHRRLALGAETAGARPALIASHHEASGDAGRAVRHRLAAGAQALRLRALPEAVMQLQKGLDDGPTPGQALDLRVQLMGALGLQGAIVASLEQAQALLALADGGGLTPRQRTEAVLAAADAMAQRDGAAGCLAVLDRLPPVLDDRQQALAMKTRATALGQMGRIEEALAAGQAALALPALQGRERAGLLDKLLMAEHLAGRPQAALDYLSQEMRVLQQEGDDYGSARALSRRGVLLIELGDTVAAETELLKAEAACERLGLVGLQRSVLYNLCCLYSAQSRPTQVLDLARRCWALQPAMEAGGLRVMVRLAFVDVHLALGDLGQAWLQASAAVDDAVALGAPMPLAAVGITALELLALLGEQATAARLVAALGSETLREMRGTASELRVAQAQAALMAGDTVAAQQALADIGAPGDIANERVRTRHAQALAELALADGDAAGALAALPADETPGMNEEMRARGLALRLMAECQAGRPGAATLLAAAQALAAPTVHTLPALALQRALTSARQAGGTVLADTDGGPQASDGLVTRLAATLQAFPAQRAAFLAHCA